MDGSKSIIASDNSNINMCACCSVSITPNDSSLMGFCNKYTRRKIQFYPVLKDVSETKADPAISHWLPKQTCSRLFLFLQGFCH